MESLETARRWNLEMESEDGVSSQRCGAGRDPSLQLPCNLQPLAATATGRRSIVGRSGRLARGRLQPATTLQPGGWPVAALVASRRDTRRRACDPPQPGASFLACRGGVVPVAFTSRFHSERLCRGRGGEVHSRLCAAVAADRGREAEAGVHSHSDGDRHSDSARGGLPLRGVGGAAILCGRWFACFKLLIPVES